MTNKTSLTFIVILMVLLGGCRNEATSVTIANPTMEPIPSVILSPTMVSTPTMVPTPVMVSTPTMVPTVTPDRSVEDGLPVVVRVNGHPIFKEAYDQKVIEQIQWLEQEGIDVNTADGQQILLQRRQMVLDSLIDQLIIEQAANQRAITVTNRTLDDIIETLNTSPETPDFEMWLVENNLSIDDYRDMLRFELISQQLKEQVIPSVPDGADQQHQFFDWLSQQRSIVAIEQYNKD